MKREGPARNVHDIAMDDIDIIFRKLESKKVLIIGDTIIDHYVFVTPKGRAVKDPILSVEYVNRKIYPGGILAIANHLSDFVKEATILTLIGDHDDHLDFINKSLKHNISLRYFVKEGSPTTVKKRVIDYYRKNKLFKVEYMNDRPITDKLSDKILEFLDSELDKYDLVLIGDFGHGFIDDKIRKRLEDSKKYLCINVQNNSSNMGYNLFTKYKRFYFITLNEPELRTPLLMRFDDIDNVIYKASESYSLSHFLVTRGKEGLIYVNDKDKVILSSFANEVKDTVGAGDAVFSIASLLASIQTDSQLLANVSNAAGAIAANIIGNESSITKEKIKEFLDKK